MLKGKHLLLCISGSIAAYKSAALCSALVKQGCIVDVLMTANATRFVSPLTFETLTGCKTHTDTFDRNFRFNVEHISLAQKADLILVAPATANLIAKLAHGIADDMVTTTILAATCKKILAPAMNTQMYLNKVTQKNMTELTSLGWEIVTPGTGLLACGDLGIGKMPEPEILLEVVLQELAYNKDMLGLKVMVTAGPTREFIDPVRFITNPSSGKMGYAIARAAAQRGAEVTLVTGKTSISPPARVTVVPADTAEDMFQAVTSRSDDQDIIIKAAAVADYRPSETATEKVKKGDGELSLSLTRTRDILKYLGEHRTEKQFLCGFSMETEHLLENSRKKLEGKHLDMIAANDLKEEDAGFGTDTNHLILITKDEEIDLPVLSKEAAAHRLLDEIIKARRSPGKHDRNF
jgi:phosphopantothenoylcysteine decarboxylase/phosphopantothenate--cysteine ligase